VGTRFENWQSIVPMSWTTRLRLKDGVGISRRGLISNFRITHLRKSCARAATCSARKSRGEVRDYRRDGSVRVRRMGLVEAGAGPRCGGGVRHRLRGRSGATLRQQARRCHNHAAGGNSGTARETCGRSGSLRSKEGRGALLWDATTPDQTAAARWSILSESTDLRKRLPRRCVNFTEAGSCSRMRGASMMAWHCCTHCKRARHVATGNRPPAWRGLAEDVGVGFKRGTPRIVTIAVARKLGKTLDDTVRAGAL
jgi:hypothetical protein